MCSELMLGELTTVPGVDGSVGGMGVAVAGMGVGVDVDGNASHVNVDIICVNTADSAARSNSGWGGSEVPAFR